MIPAQQSHLGPVWPLGCLFWQTEGKEGENESAGPGVGQKEEVAAV